MSDLEQQINSTSRSFPLPHCRSSPRIVVKYSSNCCSCESSVKQMRDVEACSTAGSYCSFAYSTFASSGSGCRGRHLSKGRGNPGKLGENFVSLRWTFTIVQKYWLPAIRAEIDLRQARPSKAIDDLGAATPLDFADPGSTAVPTLYPPYARAQAYLGDGRRSKSSDGIQKVD
jgi:hypothetical protein